MITSTWGGKRAGAGRPKGRNAYGESTQPLRVPKSLAPKVIQWVKHKSFSLPLYACRVAAGFPSPADDYLEGPLDLNEYLVDHPSATFLVRAAGDSMIDAGIFPNDVLVVDRSLNPQHNDVVIAVVANELTVKRLYKKDGRIKLVPENKSYEPISIKDTDELLIWGVVRHVIHSF